MDRLFWLSQEQLERIKPLFPKSRGVSRVDDRKVLAASSTCCIMASPASCSSRLRTLQNPLQPLPLLVREGSFQVDLLRIGRIRRHRASSWRRARGWCSAGRDADDGCHLCQSPSHRLQPQQGGAAPRLIGRTKGASPASSM